MNRRIGKLARIPLLALCCAMLLVGCATVDKTSMTKFQEGVATVRQNSQALFLDYNAFVREMQLERAVNLSRLTESDVAAGLDAESQARWSTALDALALYASSLQLLASPSSGEGVQANLTNLGNRIIALAPSPGGGAQAANEAIGHLGNIIVQQAANAKALEVARTADPAVRNVLGHMADMVGSDHASGLRGTMWSNWTTKSTGHQVRFLAPGADKRKVAAEYAQALDSRQAHDTSLAALRASLLDLADLHTAAAQGRTADAETIVATLRQEVAFARQLVSTATAP